MRKLKTAVLLSAAIAAMAAATTLADTGEFNIYSEYGISLSDDAVSEGVKGLARLAPQGVISEEPSARLIGLMYAPMPSETALGVIDDPANADPGIVEALGNAAGYTAYALITDAPLEEIAASLFDPASADQVLAGSEEEASAEGYHYYYLASPDYDAEEVYTMLSATYPDQFPAEELEAWVADNETAQNNFREALKNSEHFAPKAAGAAYIGQTLSFDTEDVDGNPVSIADLFAENEITMVNLWGTWCPACMSEMAELAGIHREFREKGCGIVGLEKEYGWTDENIAASKETIAENGIEYPNVKMPEDNELLNSAGYFPTSLFVDREGKILVEPIVGVDPDAYRETLESLLAGAAEDKTADAGDESAAAEDESAAAEAETAATEAESAAAEDKTADAEAESAAAEDKTAAAEDKTAATEATAYTVLVTDEAGAPVEGAVIQFCTADSCFLGTTDAKGEAVFEQPEAVYTIHVLQAPEGYKKTDKEFQTAETYEQVTITLEAA